MMLCSNPLFQYLSHKEEIDAAVARVLQSGWYILGEEVKNFEAEFARFIGVKHAIGVGNGTDALHLSLAACGIADGDEVITVSHTAVATVAAIVLAGAVPVFADIEPECYTLDPAQLEKKITSKTKAIVPVHLYGQAAAMEPLLEMAARYGLKVIEDCAQATGAQYNGRRLGSLGDAGCFSFYPTKNLGALGDGGMITTNCGETAERIRSLREYGWRKARFISEEAGWNSRLDEIQAAILRVKLKYLEEENARRGSIARQYAGGLRDTGISLPVMRENTGHVFHLYVVRTPRRDALCAHLSDKGIKAAVHYPLAVHQQTAYQAYAPADLKVTERIIPQILTLPMYPELTDEEVNSVIHHIKNFQ